MRALIPVTVLALGAAALSPASAQTPPPWTFAESRVYFTCKNENVKLQNAYGNIGWTNEAPSGSVKDGNGCAFADPGPSIDPGLDGPDDAFYVGDVVGNVRDLTFEGYVTGPALSQVVRNEINLGVALSIDGNTMYGTSGDEPERIPLQPTSVAGTYKVEFTMTNWPWMGWEEGDGTKVRRVELHVSPWVTQSGTTWVWGGSEVPAGITFNDPTPADELLGLYDDDDAAAR